MKKIHFGTSLAIDAICWFDATQHDYGQTEKQKEFIDKLKPLVEGKIIYNCISMSTLSLILSTYLTFDELSALDIEGLIRVFENFEKVNATVREKTLSEFTKSYLFPALDELKEGKAKIYIENLKILKAAGFEELWRELAQPEELCIIKSIEQLLENVSDDCIDKVLELVSVLKDKPKEDNIDIFTSLLSFPVSFTLFGSSFLFCACSFQSHVEFISHIAHELMHGFSDDQLTCLYLRHTEKSPYLQSCHYSLMSDMHSGNEEKFVMAAEYYITYLVLNIKKDELLRNKFGRYGGCVPLSVILFDLLTIEPAPPRNYCSWLKDRFDHELKEMDVFNYIDALLPPTTTNNEFFENIFCRFLRMIYIIRWLQRENKVNLREKIIAASGVVPAEKRAKEIIFCQTVCSVENAVKVEESSKDGITLSIAEFETYQDALKSKVRQRGTNITPYSVCIDGDYYEPYFVNLSGQAGSPRPSVTFILDNIRYTLTVDCPEYVIFESTYDDFIAKYARELVNTVQRLEKIILSLQA
jgi:hypothetical protein